MELSESVLDALRAGNKIEAIKRLRKERQLSLRDAKLAVENWQATGQPFPRSTDEETGRSRGALPEEAVAALLRGNRIEAIRRLRQTRSMSLKEAKQAIDAWRADQTEMPPTPGTTTKPLVQKSLFVTLAVIATFTWMLVNLVDVASALVVLTNQAGYRQAIFKIEKLRYQNDAEDGHRWGFEGKIDGLNERFYAPSLADRDKLGYAGLRRRFPPGTKLSVWYNPRVTSILFQGRTLHLLPYAKSVSGGEYVRLLRWAFFCLLPFLLTATVAARKKRSAPRPDAENGRPLVPTD